MRPSSLTWPARNVNVTVLLFVGPLLLLAGALGFLLPARAQILSAATPYNVFHILAGAFGAALAVRARPRAAAAFNLAFGCFDLYQAGAGPLGLFPAAAFALGPADHLVHVALGLPLAVVGWRGLRPPRARSAASPPYNA